MIFIYLYFHRWLLSKDLSVWTIYLQASFYIFLICHKNLKTRKLIKRSNVDIEISQHLYIFILKFLMTAGFFSFNRWPLDKDLSVSWVIHPQPKFYYFFNLIYHKTLEKPRFSNPGFLTGPRFSKGRSFTGVWRQIFKHVLIVDYLFLGQILNRFSGDIYFLDSELPWSYFDFAYVSVV